MNYPSLADFRTAHESWLDAQLTRSVISLLDRRLPSAGRFIVVVTSGMCKARFTN